MDSFKQFKTAFTDNGVYPNYIPGIIFKRLGNYVQGTSKNAFGNRTNWPTDTKIWRGHIVDLETGLYAGRPFDKFFELGQYKVNNRFFYEHLVNNTMTVSEKVDGFPVFIWYSYSSLRWMVSSKNEINLGESDNAIIDKCYCDLRYFIDYCTEFRKITSSDFWKSFTFIFELIQPTHRRVTKYDNANAILIGVRNNISGVEILPKDLQSLGKDIAMSTPMDFNIDYNPLGHLIQYQKTYKDSDVSQGFVVRFDNNGQTSRIKIINQHYKDTKKLLSIATPENTIECLKNGTFDKVILTLPKEFSSKMLDIKECIDKRISKITYWVEETLLLKPTEKQMKQLIHENINPLYYKYATAVWFGRDVYPCIDANDLKENLIFLKSQ